MKYQVRSKTYSRSIAEFDSLAWAVKFCKEQRKTWTNATMQIYKGNSGEEVLVREFSPLKPTKYLKKTLSMEPNYFLKLRKKDVHGHYKVDVDPSKIWMPEPEDDEFYGESLWETVSRVQKEVDKTFNYNIEDSTKLSLKEKFLWFITPTETIVTEDMVIKVKKRSGKLFIVSFV